MQLVALINDWLIIIHNPLFLHTFYTSSRHVYVRRKREHRKQKRDNSICLSHVCTHLPFELLDILLEVTSSVHKPPLRRIRFTELTDGIVLGSQIFCEISWSRISHANIPGFSCLKRSIFFTTVGVATCWKRHNLQKKKSINETGVNYRLHLCPNCTIFMAIKIEFSQSHQISLDM